MPEDRQLGKARQNVWRINGFPQTHRPAAGCVVLAFLESSRDAGVGAIALVLCSFDLDKVMCHQGLFKRVPLGCRKCLFHPLTSCSCLCFLCWWFLLSSPTLEASLPRAGFPPRSFLTLPGMGSWNPGMIKAGRVLRAHPTPGTIQVSSSTTAQDSTRLC